MEALQLTVLFCLLAESINRIDIRDISLSQSFKKHNITLYCYYLHHILLYPQILSVRNCQPTPSLLDPKSVWVVWVENLTWNRSEVSVLPPALSVRDRCKKCRNPPPNPSLGDPWPRDPPNHTLSNITNSRRKFRRESFLSYFQLLYAVLECGPSPSISNTYGVSSEGIEAVRPSVDPAEGFWRPI